MVVVADGFNYRLVVLFSGVHSSGLHTFQCSWNTWDYCAAIGKLHKRFKTTDKCPTLYIVIFKVHSHLLGDKKRPIKFVFAFPGGNGALHLADITTKLLQALHFSCYYKFDLLGNIMNFHVNKQVGPNSNVFSRHIFSALR